MNKCQSISAACLALLLASAQALSQATFTRTGIYQCFHSPVSVSADGRVVATAEDCGAVEPYRWTHETGPIRLSGGQGAPESVSDDGAVICGWTERLSGTGYEPCLWIGDDVIRLGLPEGEPRSLPMTCVSGDGRTVFVSFASDAGWFAWRWTAAGGYEYLGGDPFGIIHATNRDGSVAVGLVAEDHKDELREAAYWTAAAGFVRIGRLPGATWGSWANGVSSDGAVIVGGSYTGQGIEPFRWTAATGMVGLGTLPGEDRDEARDVTADGRLVTVESGSSFRARACLWDPDHGLRDLNELLPALGAQLPGGFQLAAALGVSDNGRVITGRGFSHDDESWVATLCRPDCDEEGHLNVNDFTCFQYMWRTRTSYGDYNADGKWTINDFIAFQADWRRGCR